MNAARDEIRRRVDCREVAERLGVRVKVRTGERWTAHCFSPDGHNNGDRNPSMAVFRDGYKCFGCGESGDVFELWQRIEGVGFAEAVAALADVAGVSIDQETPHGATRATHARRKAKRYGMGGTATETRLRGPESVISDQRRDVWRNLWEITRPLCLTETGKTWLRNRGVGVDVAAAYGCRDWLPAADAIRAYLNGLSREELAAAGLVNDEGKPWAPLRALKGERDWQGLAVPMWHPEAPDAPVGVRWRFYSEPWPDGPKAMGQPKSSPLVAWHIIGGPLPLKLARCLYWWPHHAPDDAGGWPEKGRPVAAERAPVAVLLLEGETDWLAAASALVSVNTPWRIVPVGLCAISAGWPDELTRYIAGADRVICMFDKGRGESDPAGLKAARSVALSLVKAIGAEEAERRFCAYLLPDDDDAADRHKRGELWPLINDLLTRE